VMKDGQIQQIGTAHEVYDRPKNKFIADFIGIANLLDGRVIKKVDAGEPYGLVEVSDEVNRYGARCVIPPEIQEGEEIVLFFRPENTRFMPSQTGDGMNVFRGRISNLIYLGNYIDCRIQVGRKEIRAQVSPEEELREDQELFIGVDPKHCVAVKR